MRQWLFLFTIIGGMALPGLAGAAEKEYYKALVDKPVVNAGESLVYSVEVMTGGEQQYSPDITPPDLSGSFQVIDTFTRSAVNIFNGKTYIITFKEVHLVANHKGKIIIPASKVEIKNPQTQQFSVYETNTVLLSVNESTGKAAIATATPEIDILRPTKHFARISFSQWLPFAIGLFLLAAVFGTSYYLKHRPEPAPEVAAVPVDNRSPEERALEGLSNALALKESGRINEFYTILSVILRRYMAETFNFKAEQATTREMLDEMKRLDFKPAFLNEFGSYFEECDKVKFANLKPSHDKVEAAAPQVKYFIKKTDKRNNPEPAPVLLNDGDAEPTAAVEAAPAKVKAVEPKKPRIT